MENTEQEKEIKNIRAYDKEVNGCRRHQKDVMISFNTNEEGGPIRDLFLNQVQAEHFLHELSEAVLRNQEIREDEE